MPHPVESTFTLGGHRIAYTTYGEGPRVIAIDIDQTKLDFARRLGAEVGVLASDDVVAAIVEHATGGAQVSMDALGSRVTCYKSA